MGTQKKKNFLRIFLGISLSMLSAVFVGFGIIYATVRDIIIDQNIEMSMESFQQVQGEVEAANEAARIIASQVLMDDVSSDFFSMLLSRKQNKVLQNRVRNQLSMYENVNHRAESIYIYDQASEILISSGSRYPAAKKEKFVDQDIVEILENPDKYNSENLFCRNTVPKYSDIDQKARTVYSYIMHSEPGKRGNAVVVNMELDDVLSDILSRDLMQDSWMLIYDGAENVQVSLDNLGDEKIDDFLPEIDKMAEESCEYRVCRVGKDDYFISRLFADQSGWNYVKITKYDTMFSNLRDLLNWMLCFLAALTAAVVAIALANTIPILKIHNRLEKKYALTSQVKRSDINVLMEGFLNDFLHRRKLYDRNRLRMEMGKFGFSFEENDRFTVVILEILSYEKLKETCGDDTIYDIKYGFHNIFAETFQEQFKNLGIINRDGTLTFILKVNDEEKVLEDIRDSFRKFLQNVKIFMEWDFILYAVGQCVSLERTPKLNSMLKEAAPEGFFYEANSCITYEEIIKDHCGEADFQQLDSDSIIKLLNGQEDGREVYRSLAERMRPCRMSDYMNTMIWLGITIARNTKQYRLSKQEGNDFLVQLSKCERASEVDQLFLQLFDLILANQENASVKRGVSGKLDEVKLYIKNGFRDPNLTLEHLGDEFGVSPNYLGRLFKKDTGMSVADYINNERLNQVIKELEETDRSAKEIAEECGFVSSNYFYTYFRKKVGMTPQTYREQHKDENSKKL